MASLSEISASFVAAINLFMSSISLSNTSCKSTWLSSKLVLDNCFKIRSFTGLSCAVPECRLIGYAGCGVGAIGCGLFTDEDAAVADDVPELRCMDEEGDWTEFVCDDTDAVDVETGPDVNDTEPPLVEKKDPSEDNLGEGICSGWGRRRKKRMMMMMRMRSMMMRMRRGRMIMSRRMVKTLRFE